MRNWSSTEEATAMDREAKAVGRHIGEMVDKKWWTVDVPPVLGA